MEAREYLSICYRTCRELVQHVAILTREDSIEAIQWRQDVAYKTILLLRVTMAAIEVRMQDCEHTVLPTMLYSLFHSTLSIALRKLIHGMSWMNLSSY